MLMIRMKNIRSICFESYPFVANLEKHSLYNNYERCFEAYDVHTLII